MPRLDMGVRNSTFATSSLFDHQFKIGDCGAYTCDDTTDDRDS